jgi:anaerobic ribonucleoside-triphosphate reductase
MTENKAGCVNCCEGCALKDEERQPCEVWTRVMGYYRPVSEFNCGKKSEQAERVCFMEK